MHESLNNLISIKKEINNKNSNTQIIAVSKTFPASQIAPLIDYGHIHYGENKVQESLEKWTELKKRNDQIKLHMIGKLQTNKVKFAVPLFDYIHSLDNLKLADKINSEQEKKRFKPKIFIQVNIGNEIQKSGVKEEDLGLFIKDCRNKFKLDIIGLMCIPPNDNNEEFYFKKMYELCKKFKLNELSMGMSNDYKLAIENGATFIRVGSKIFGERTK